MTGFPKLELNKANATAALTPAARRVHLAVLTAFADTGHAPARADLLRLASEHGSDPDTVLTELAEQDVIAFDDAGEIRAAYPFSPTPTSIRVTWEGGPATYAMCAIDALGMSAMLDRPAAITATDPSSGDTVTVEVDRTQARWNPDTAVVFAGAIDGACCPSVDRTCGHINFFASGHTAHEWAASHPQVSGVILDQTQALTAGVAEFAALMRLDRC